MYLIMARPPSYAGTYRCMFSCRTRPLKAPCIPFWYHLISTKKILTLAQETAKEPLHSATRVTQQCLRCHILPCIALCSAPRGSSAPSQILHLVWHPDIPFWAEPSLRLIQLKVHGEIVPWLHSSFLSMDNLCSCVCSPALFFRFLMQQ